MSLREQVIDMERSLIGCAMVCPKARKAIIVGEIVAKYPAERCVTPLHSQIVAVVSEMLDKGHDVTLVSLSAECASRSIKGATRQYLTQCGEEAVPVADFHALMQTLLAHNRAVRLAEAFQQASEDVERGSVSERAETASRAIREIDRIIMDGDELPAYLLGSAEASTIRAGQGIPTPLASLNKRMFVQHGGWPCPGLAIINGYRGGGKTMFGIQCAMRAAADGWPVLFLSLEMTESQIEMRAMQMLTGSPTLPQMEDLWDDANDVWHERRSDLEKLGIKVVCPTRATIADVERSVLQWYREHRRGLVVLDYVQLVQATNRRQELYQQTVEVAERLGQLARVCEGAVIIGLSQITEREGKVISRGGQDYEVPAHFVMVIQPDHLRDDYHGVDIDSESRYVRINVTKQRFGPGAGEWLMCKFDNRNLLLEDAPLSDAEIEWMRQQRGNKR